MNLKKDDKVLVLAGRDKGKKGKVISVAPADGKLTVEAVNVVKRHQRATQKFPGGIIEKPMPLFASKVMLVCPRCSQPTRIAARVVDGKKVRVCKKCAEIIDKV